MVATIAVSQEDRDIQEDIKKLVHTHNGEMYLLDIARTLSKEKGYSHWRVRDWTIRLINDGELQDGPSRLITMGE